MPFSMNTGPIFATWVMVMVTRLAGDEEGKGEGGGGKGDGDGNWGGGQR